MDRKKILVIGSTGSIGSKTLDVIENNQNLFEVDGLSCKSNVELMCEQGHKFGVKKFAVADKSKYIKAETDWYWGDEGIEEMIRNSSADLVVMAISGAKSLGPTIAAIESRKDVALASKEVMVMAGEIINQKVKEYKVKLLPIDSEHSAIWQSLRSGKNDEIEKVILTCSGGPFLHLNDDQFKNIKLEDALKHPNWVMGKRITIDCATLLNKGLEFIEAKWLFNLSNEQIEVVVHPQSLIHSAIQFKDGSIVAQIGDRDMRIPIQYALTYPDRIPNKLPRINWFGLKMDFEKPDLNKFPCLGYALKAAEIGGTMPVVLNAADEVAVDLFIKQKITFLGISQIIERVMNKHEPILAPNLDEIIQTDDWARKEALII
jgi:1-deoxy-D-xylulose-5-phosphate reductoisomerase